MSQMRFKQLSMPWTPHSYQKEAVKFLIEHAAGALFLDPGLGKTAITLAAIKLLKKKEVLSKVLIVAPLRVSYLVWPKEIEVWKDFNKLKIVILHGPHKEELLKEDADIYVINPEGLEWLLKVEKKKAKSGRMSVNVDVRRWKKLGFDTLVIDELSKFKHTSSARFKALKLVLHTFSRRWGLTGSPAANGLMDLFGQCYIIDQGRSLGRFITHYRRKYFDAGYDGFSYTLKEGADELIYDAVRPIALRMGEELIDIPKLISNKIKVELPEKSLAVYIEVENKLISKIEDGTVTAKTSAVASMKCRQIANGAVYLDQEVEALIKLPSSKREWAEIHNAKLDALGDLVSELQGNPLLVAYDFAHDLERLKSKFGKDTPHIGKGVNTKKLVEIEQAWNEGGIPLLFGQCQSVSHGLNMQGAASHVAWFGLTWDYDVYDQFIRRVRRQGNKHKHVYCHHIVASGTIDEIILMTLMSKRRGQNALFDALKKIKKR